MAIVENAVVDPFHNKHINFVTEQSSEVYTYVHVPSRYYVFDDLVHDDLGDDYEKMWMRGIGRKSMRYIQGPDVPRGEIALCVSGSILRHCLKVVRELSKHQNWLTITWVSVFNIPNFTMHHKDDCYEEYSELAETFFETFRFGDNVKSVSVCSSEFSHDMQRHIVRELCGKAELEELVLVSNHYQLPMKFGKTLATLMSLKKLDLSGCDMPGDRCEELAEALNQLPLVELDCQENKMGNCLDLLLLPSGKKSMKRLNLKDCYLSKEDGKNLAQTMSHGLLPVVEELNLYDNTLTDCLAEMLSGSGLPYLKILDLGRTELSESDVEGISGAVKEGKLPQLEELILESNKLSDHYNDLLGGTKHPGFQSLKKMSLRDTDPSDADLGYLVQAMKDEKFSKLENLDFGCNSLSDRETDAVHSVVKACIDYGRRGFKLQLAGNYIYLNDEKQAKLESLVKSKAVIISRMCIKFKYD